MVRILWIGVVAVFLMVGGAAQASDPAVVGKLQGLELAQQTGFNPAVFVGVFSGKVDGKIAIGTWAVGVQHEVPLPDTLGESIAITGGRWQMQVWVLQGFRLRRIALSGAIAGRLAYFSADRFQIDTVMNVTSGGSGDIALLGILDHTVFPPGVSATLSQP